MGRISGLFLIIIVGIGMPQIGLVNGWGKEGHYITCSIAQVNSWFVNVYP